MSSVSASGGPTAVPAVRAARPADAPRLREIMLAVLETDAPPATTRADVERSVELIVAEPDSALVSLEAGIVAGLLLPATDDLSVDPALRRRGHGRALVAAGRELMRSLGGDHLQLWVPDDGPGRRFAEALGFRYSSSLWLFRLPPSVDVPPAAFPPDVVVRPVRPGVDEPAQVALIETCFADHPTPVTATLEWVRHVQSQPTFDPWDVLLMAAAADPDRLIGFCRTAMSDAGDERRGHLRLLGVVPGWRGRRLGLALLRWGIGRVRERGADVVELSVEARNRDALELYLRTGFEPAVEWPHWIIDV